jgi:ATP-dependent DNA ligase
MSTLLRHSPIWDMPSRPHCPYTQGAVLDGEIVCLDRRGRPQFKDLLFRRGVPCFFAFDLLYDGKDRRRDALVDHKLELRRMIGRFSRTSRLQYVDHIEETGTELFRHSVSWILKAL